MSAVKRYPISYPQAKAGPVTLEMGLYSNVHETYCSTSPNNINALVVEESKRTYSVVT